MNSGIFNLNEISEVEMQSDEDKEELGLDKIEELLESGAKGARWSDDAKVKADSTNNDSEAKSSSSKKRQRVDSETAVEDEEHAKKRSKWDVINASEGGVVKTTGNDMTVSSLISFVIPGSLLTVDRIYLVRTARMTTKQKKRKAMMPVNTRKKRAHL